ncbi:MAG: leucine-rich repeat domain-containing protein [Bdellovibrionales bacterium]|nr:leucine-rich repeat domain-containing protein [Bdellovibrionales bacterium]
MRRSLTFIYFLFGISLSCGPHNKGERKPQFPIKENSIAEETRRHEVPEEEYRNEVERKGPSTSETNPEKDKIAEEEIKVHSNSCDAGEPSEVATPSPAERPEWVSSDHVISFSASNIPVVTVPQKETHFSSETTEKKAEKASRFFQYCSHPHLLSHEQIHALSELKSRFVFLYQNCEQAAKVLYSLTSIDLSGLGLRDLSLISGLPNLEVLDASRNQLRSTSGLSDLPQLKHLDLSDNRLEGVTNVLEFKQLESLNLSHNQIVDWGGLDHLTQLRELDISFNPEGDFSFLSEFSQVEKLHLIGLKLENIDFIYHLKFLSHLNLSHNGINDITPLSDLLRLNQLHLRNNLINDIGPLAYLGQLQVLDLGFNQIHNIDSLTHLGQLQWLDISHNLIEDMTPLNQLTMDLELRIKAQGKISREKDYKGGWWKQLFSW